MAKRSDIRRFREFRVEDDAGKSPPKTVRIISVFGAGRYIINGAVTGKRYEFVGNTALEIDEQDALFLLAIRKGGCCGHPNPVPIFMAV